MMFWLQVWVVMMASFRWLWSLIRKLVVWAWSNILFNCTLFGGATSSLIDNLLLRCFFISTIPTLLYVCTTSVIIRVIICLLWLKQIVVALWMLRWDALGFIFRSFTRFVVLLASDLLELRILFCLMLSKCWGSLYDRGPTLSMTLRLLLVMMIAFILWLLFLLGSLLRLLIVCRVAFCLLFA